ncbi:TIGR03089 family protein [Corynebacterium heidelbergense]|uniref:TIGR03089 family protein n=1 Tax=Corynebacterium heidelbergense TaxID=2055947 RepID=A0A364V583_9CORY|nr:TIGR03089 family protein [Corynebacterium heidelbergense]RAV31792.1 TIGR03089 family protein [Corynebacterium heidelbergense]
MDLIAPLLTNPASPRVTTYTPEGRAELSAETLANWSAKAANLLVELDLGAGDRVAVAAATGWQPITVALGAWRVGAAITEWRSDQEEPGALFTDSIEVAEAAAEAGVPEVYVLSTDPLGRAVWEPGRQPFGLNDYAEELRMQPDAYSGARVDGQPLLYGEDGPLFAQDFFARASTELPHGGRVLQTGWSSTAGMCEALLPLFAGGSVVLSTDCAPERLQQLADVEKAVLR